MVHDRDPERDDGTEIVDEQTLADADQTVSDSDQTLSDRDQQASDEDQDASDRDHDQGGEDDAAHARTTSERAATSRERDKNASRRDQTGQQRDIAAQQRDELALLQDEVARARDEDATVIDARDEVADRHTTRVEDLRARSRVTRARAAGDRDRAARDRDRGADNRRQAASDRERAAYDRDHAGADELTGARRRGVGLEELENEVQRARREGENLVAAYVDVDGLKAVNDQDGHPAGDRLLEGIAQKLRRRMRSYDLIVRLGGDEFLVVVPRVSLAEAQRRFEDLRSGEGSVSIGFSELRDDESADELIRRADRDLLTARASAPGRGVNALRSVDARGETSA